MITDTPDISSLVLPPFLATLIILREIREFDQGCINHQRLIAIATITHKTCKKNYNQSRNIREHRLARRHVDIALIAASALPYLQHHGK